MPGIEELLEKSRNELLDLSTRNRLLSIPVSSKSARIIQIQDELSDEVLRLLTASDKKERRSFSFLAGKASKKRGAAMTSAPLEEGIDGGEEDESEEGSLPPVDEAMDAGAGTGPARRHVDSRLQSALTPEGLQRRLLDLYRDARTMIEEQGVNILYLSLGQLKWFEAEQSDTARYAPLILVPVSLSRKSVSERFVLTWTEEEIEENLSLRAKLKADFGIELPPFPEEEDFKASNYFEAVAKAVASAKNWEVLPNAITLGFFSFAKFLMYRDLMPENWPKPEDLAGQPFIRGLLQDGFPQADPLFPDEANLDELIPVNRLDHVVDADGSQTLAIESVRQGRSMVIQGPPGTGKSQSITNIIATAVLDGKRVLFVAEKLAALEVVKRRLGREGLGALCLELHSNKSNKRAVIEEIGRTWKLGKPKAGDLENLVPRLEARRATLNEHVAALHEMHQPSALTPFSVIGQLTILGARGAEAGDVAFDGAEKWTPDQRREYRQLVEGLAERIQQIGIPNQHPWRGACRETVLNIDLEPLLKEIRNVRVKLDELRETAEALAEVLSQRAPATFIECEHQRIIGGYVAEAPPLDKAALCSTVWNAGLGGIRDLVEEGRKFAAACEQLKGKVVETVWERDFSAARASVAAHGKSWFRFLNGEYRRSLAEVRGSLAIELPKTYEERLALIDGMVAGQRAFKQIRAAESLGQGAFGAMWRRERTDWNSMATVLDWVQRQKDAGLGESFRRMFVDVTDQAKVGQITAELGERLAAAREVTSHLFQSLALDHAVAFGAGEFDAVPLAELRQRCDVWVGSPEELSRWNAYYVRARTGRAAGLGQLIALLESGAAGASAAADGYDRVYFGQILREMVRRKPALGQFDGEIHNRHVAEFQGLDRERLALAKYRALNAHYQTMPPLNAGVGAAGIVKAEMERKRGHRTVRRLLKDAGTVVQSIKPVFMMSPLSVAQFLEPGAVGFDLLVIDEASQVQPVDALGAVARAKQIVVVGDSKQLPPTRFFARLTSGDDSAAEDEDTQPAAAQAQDLESILGLCRARGIPEKMLRWHYRSRHHSLIAVSNHEFYEDKLFIVPSPFSVAAGLGLGFHHIPEGVFDSGASGTNRIEAKAICRAVIEHARTTPKLSLGVAAFSVRQQQAILDELELLRRENPEIESFFAGNETEPFFVKNLENVQGDERDVIFISVGYGKDVHGYMAMRFGPLSNEGGERRLNVLISRAKLRCEVFSSITAEDIDLQRASGRGVAALKTFLSFAQTGKLSVAHQSGEEEQSPFEEAVRRGVESLGHEVHPQVGVAGFYIDLAVVDRERQGRYLLGIECDGAGYHSSRSARDRDRLRQAVLEAHGWVIHRVWSTDWFQRPAEQLRKVAEAIEKGRVTESGIEIADKASSDANVEGNSEIEREAELEAETLGISGLSVPYEEARFEVPAKKEPHELGTAELAGIVIRVVEIEGPIHEDEIVNRVRGLWGFGRAGSRIQDAVARAIHATLVGRQCEREEGFLSIPGETPKVRTREAAQSGNLRKPEMIAPAEIRGAILALVEATHGAAEKEIPPAVARIFGFKTTSVQLRSVIERQVEKLVSQGVLRAENGLMKRGN